MDKRFIVAAALLFAAGCATHNAVQKNNASPSVAKVGALAPDWTQPTATGGTLSLASLHGKAVYLNFFATWCPPCNEEAPGINALAKRYASRGLQVVGVDELENRSKAQQFVKKYGLIYPAIVDDGTLQNQYRVNGLPVHVFIDRSGTVRKMVVGEMSQPEIATAVKSIL